MSTRRKGGKPSFDEEPEGGRAAERLRQFEDQRGYPVKPEEERKRGAGSKEDKAKRNKTKTEK